ncbi:MAG: hypothetical protein SF182_29320 [Deltaproteobacteria bacterium]|nr:hypothetical protein [Deltaproteobacteria bacterium]
MRGLALLVLSLACSGCAEWAVFKSYPAGGEVTLDGQVVGTTPMRVQIARSQVTDPHSWRIAYRNCEVATGMLQTDLAPGRIVGYVFTLGILALFRGPDYIHPVDVALHGGDCSPGASPSSVDNRQQQLQQRLDMLRDLYRRNVISRETFEHESMQAIDAAAPAAQ